MTDQELYQPAGVGVEEETPRPDAPSERVKRFKRSRTSLFAAGEPMIWLTGGSLLVGLVMILGLLVLILSFGLSTFWPREVVKITTWDGKVYMGEVTRMDTYRPRAALLEGLSPGAARAAREEMDQDGGSGLNRRSLVRTGNYRLTQSHFQWVDDFSIKEKTEPEWALVLERLEWGRFYGYPKAFVLVASIIDPEDEEGKPKTFDRKREEALELVSRFSPRREGEFRVMARDWASGGEEEVFLRPEDLNAAHEAIGVAEVVTAPRKVWALFQEFHHEVRERWRERRNLEKYDMGEMNRLQEEARLAVNMAQIELRERGLKSSGSGGVSPLIRTALSEAEQNYAAVEAWAQKEFQKIRRKINSINDQNNRFILELQTAGEGDRPPQREIMALDEIVRAYPANQLSFLDKIGIYGSRWWEYLTDEPREANSEGGVFPAIFGTVVMTLLMALAVVPFGVLAALYLREYAKSGPMVSAVRIAVNNLAGVPSIVFGVFGLGFFCYGMGSFIDGGPSWKLPETNWFILLGSSALVGAIAFTSFFLSLGRSGGGKTNRKEILRYFSLFLWVGCALLVMVLIATTPFFDGFYRAKLPNPTFGKGALIWASFTLALMTLPVVIVSTEEALSAVPNSMREGSFACGAGKWQTIRRIVLPRALPGIMTGMILAMARGAGEVAPLMLVGAVKMAPELPFSWSPPFGLNQSFMHLGFHIFDVGFQSQNSEAAKPMVFTSTLLLILIIAVLNVSAVWLRSRLRKRFVSSQF